MDFEQLKQDVTDGRIDVGRLLEVIEILSRQLRQAQQQLQEAHQRIEELEKKLGKPKTDKLDEPFSVREEEKRQAKRGKKRKQSKCKTRKGRIATAEKIAQATRTEKVFPDGVPEEACKVSHTRPVWRLEQGQATYVSCVHRPIYRRRLRRRPLANLDFDMALSSTSMHKTRTPQ